MYIFICNLCINALYGTAGFYPKFLLDLLSSHVISYTGCMLQGFVIHSSTCSDFSILALMAYDRYVAICRPLVYHSLMTKQRVSILVFLSWLLPLCLMFLNTATLLGIRLCGSHIDKMYCVNWMIVLLACSPPKANAIVAYFNILLYFGHFVFIFWSYMYIVRTCLSSKQEQQKFMQTCLPHLISLTSFSITVLLDLLYMRFGSSDLSQDLHNFMAIEFLLIPPMLNPLIYGFKLTKVRNNALKFLNIKIKDKKVHPWHFITRGKLSISNVNIGLQISALFIVMLYVSFSRNKQDCCWSRISLSHCSFSNVISFCIFFTSI